MKRVFWYSTLALVAGAALRLFFVWKFPAGAGDTIIYDQLATNWLKHFQYAMDVAGQPLSVDIRMPGYPAFLAIIYAVIRRTGESAYLAVRFVQIFVDLATCLVISALAVLLSRARAPRDASSGPSSNAASSSPPSGSARSAPSPPTTSPFRSPKPGPPFSPPSLLLRLSSFSAIPPAHFLSRLILHVFFHPHCSRSPLASSSASERSSARKRLSFSPPLC